MIMIKEVYFRELGHKITELANLESVGYRLQTQMGFGVQSWDWIRLQETSVFALKAFGLLYEAHLHCRV